MVETVLNAPQNAAADKPLPLTVTEWTDPASWDRFVAGEPAASAYHQFAWKGVIERAFHHRGVYLAAHSGDTLHGVLPLIEFNSRLFGRFAVSLPFVNYGGVLARNADMASALMAHARELAVRRRWAHVELRHFEQRFPNWPVRRHKVAMWRHLEADVDALWGAVDRKVRNLVRKAEKGGCTVEIGGAALLPEFYRVFAHNMRDLGTPVYSRGLFDEVLRSFPADTRVFVVRFEGHPIAASITIRWRDRIEVPWASALRAHNHRAPNMLLYWAMLRQAVAEGARLFDFGRSTPGEGTFHFKQQWGAQPHPMAWEYVGLNGAIPDHGPTNAKFQAAIALWQKLPVSIASAIGPSIVRNIP